MRLYLATGNAHKLEELQDMLSAARLDVEVCGPAAVGGMPEVVEDQDSFSGNALKKARSLAALVPAGSVALADDSGLRVDALGGRPGVYSARYAGEGASDEDNVEKLLKELEGLPSPERSAGFQCHLALVFSDGLEQLFLGECRGAISEKPSGRNGFGYDPVFVPQGFSRTFAEMEAEEKARLSHRGAAMRELVAWLGQMA